VRNATCPGLDELYAIFSASAQPAPISTSAQLSGDSVRVICVER